MSDNDKELFADFRRRLTLLGIEISESTEDKLLGFSRGLEDYNRHTNLVGSAELSVVLQNHILDSLALLPIVRELSRSSSNALVDIGSGAGFPGLVLAIADDNLQCTLVESVQKKCRFLSIIAENLGLDDRIEVVSERAEDLFTYRDEFDFATARAVGSLELTLELAVPLLKRGGYLLAQRSKRQIDEQSESAIKFIAELGAELVDTRILPEEVLGRQMAVMLITKVQPTPKRYPRKTQEIARAERARKEARS